MSEVLFSLPERDEDILGGWERVHYCVSWDAEEYTVCDDCGNHDPIDKEDCIKAGEEHDTKWAQYAEYVLKTGLDPLYEYHVHHYFLRKVKYTVELANSAGGARIRKWKRSHSGKWTGGLPDKTLADYLHCYKSFRPDDCRTMRPLKDYDPESGGPYGGRVYFTMKELEELAEQDEACTVSTPRDAKRLYNIRRRRFHITLKEKVPRSPASIARDLRKLARRDLGGAA